MSIESAWRQLTSVAVLGSAKRDLPTDLPPCVQQRPGADRSGALLDLATQLAVGTAAGRLPVRARNEAPPAAAPDRLRAPNDLQTQHLTVSALQSPAGARMQADLLLHWCACAEQAGVRAPGALLPQLLDLGTKQRQLQPALRAVLDTRGRWLAAQREQWAAWAAADVSADETRPDTEVWDQADGDRTEVLATLRRQDPARALHLLRRTWSTESARDRVRLLEALRPGLGPDDEDFLDECLDDRAATVRTGAQALLDALPSSRRADRMAGRLGSWVRVGWTGKVQIELPDDPDEAGVRDGLGDPPAGVSRRGWWLRRMAAGAPLDFWTQRISGGPGKVVRRLDDHQDVLAGLADAAVARRDGTWAAALLPVAGGEHVASLIPLLSAAQIRQVLSSLKDLKSTDLEQLLREFPSFSADLSNVLLDLVDDDPDLASAVLDTSGGTPRLHPVVTARLRALVEARALPTHSHRRAADIVQLFTVRHSISEAFA